MIVHQNFRGNYPEDPVRKLGLELYDDNVNDIVLSYGLGAKPKQYLHNLYYLDLEIPIIDLHESFIDYGKYCKKIINLCPYTSSWINETIGANVAQSTFFPFHEKYIQNNEKEFDAIYTGQPNSEEIRSIISVIKKFKHSVVSFGGENATHRGCSYQEKIGLISKSKISVLHNLWWPTEDYVNKIKSYPNYNKNTAYSKLDQGIVPQLKSRCFEAAFSKSLMLVRRDPWNVIEKYFHPDVDFIYYNPKTLEDTINFILDNYSSYTQIIENAYQKAINNYTVEHFMKEITK